MKRLAIDPGDKHVGYAHDFNGEVESGEWTPAECTNAVVHFMTQELVDELIIEEWVLYEWEKDKQVWSDFKSVQLIGALKLIAHWFQVPVFMQEATIKKPTRRQLQARGIKHVGKVIHARDAELHLYYRRIRRAREEETECQSQQSLEVSSAAKVKG